MTKAPDAFRTISEVADDLDLPQHVLRFWETKFSQIKPLKRGGGRRYYRPDDIDLLRGIRHLLYEEGYTIRGLQRIFKEQGTRFVIGIGHGEFDEDPASRTEKGIGESETRADPEDRSGTGKQAVAVSDLTRSGKRGGILKRLRGLDDETARTGSAGSLDSDDRRRLQATLHELLECKRLLDQVRGS